ncbi:hypothetical protein [Nocardia goodfellowii]|uniref:Peptidoglycan/LPS O-acetylase OafA/YrhL n=1 Tax=Nocardia goodfellowii TaxID=882446 RepID=A0ABS4QE70_9NOCA|nr:hypothetical protein [Nocardia goodfellowii]MBP2189455.1 peptidoglycan/LPS O-acetylase OafA/YrhL [Nocardia goodfellowii]
MVDSDRNAANAGVPATVRGAGGLVALEGGVAVTVAIVLVVRGLLGHDQSATSGYGTAAWFGILGGAVLAAGVGLLTGHRWGRAIAVIAQILLLPVAWSLLTDSHQPVYGTLLGIVAIAALGLLFAPASNRWMTEAYGVDPSAERKA